MALTRPRYSQIYDTDYKQSVRVATTTDVGNLLATGNMVNTIDGNLLVADDRILVKDQNDAKQNGIYKVVTVGTGSNGTWIRASDADAIGNGKVTSGMTTTVTEGTVNYSKTFKLATPDPIIVGTTELTFIDPFTRAAVGANTHVQFNDNGSLLGTSGFTFNKTSNVLTVTGNISSTSGYFLGNGALLTGIVSGGSPDKISSSASNVTVTSSYVNVAINGSNVASFSSLGFSITGNLYLLGASLAAIYGGTGQTTYATGDLLYATSSTTLARLPAGGANEVLQIHANAVPYWGNIDGGTY
jgi:hypothetical protein